jgi:hypothetical protein
MNIQGSDVTLSIFIVGVATIAISWMNTRACNTIVKPVVVECAEACGSAGMLERDRDGNCRCRTVADAGAADTQ